MTSKKSWVVAASTSALVLTLVFAFGNDILIRPRLVGLWHVEGSFADWRFGWDGSYREEALISSSGRYELLSGGRIRLAAALGPPLTYQYRFEDGGLRLIGVDGNPNGFRLVPKR